MKSFFNPILFLFSFIVFFACEKKKVENPKEIVFETGTMTDAKGKVYQTVKIGNQWWMAEDLTVDVYRNNEIIKKFDDNTQWSSDTSGAFVISKGNYYYNWYAVRNSKLLAPEGWHIPSDQEWKQLENHLGMNDADANRVGWRGEFEGNKLKYGGQFVAGITDNEQRWKNQANILGFEFVNESGFSAVANNCRLFNGTFGLPDDLAQGFWWSSSVYNLNEAWFRNLDYKKTNIFRSHVLKNYGFCVRCVKD